MSPEPSRQDYCGEEGGYPEMDDLLRTSAPSHSILQQATGALFYAEIWY